MSEFNFDSQPNPNNPRLAEFIPGDLKTSSGRRVKQRAHVCNKCYHVTWRTFETKTEAAVDELCPEPCEACGESFGDKDRLKKGWIYEPIDSSFNARAAFLPDHHKTPSLQNERFVR